ncbi:MAG: hypothetical protein AB1609_08870 [Bacillota bacterium]
MRSARAVVDASALAPSLFYQGLLFRAIRHDLLVPLVIPEIYTELTAAVLAICAREAAPNHVRELILRACELVYSKSPRLMPMPPDYAVPELKGHMKDAHLFWVAEHGRADVIIVREPRLETIGEWRGVPILRPRHALEYLGLLPAL